MGPGELHRSMTARILALRLGQYTPYRFLEQLWQRMAPPYWRLNEILAVCLLPSGSLKLTSPCSCESLTMTRLTE